MSAEQYEKVLYGGGFPCHLSYTVGKPITDASKVQQCAGHLVMSHKVLSLLQRIKSWPLEALRQFKRIDPAGVFEKPQDFYQHVRDYVKCDHSTK